MPAQIATRYAAVYFVNVSININLFIQLVKITCIIHVHVHVHAIYMLIHVLVLVNNTTSYMRFCLYMYIFSTLCTSQIQVVTWCMLKKPYKSCTLY